MGARGVSNVVLGVPKPTELDRIVRQLIVSLMRQHTRGGEGVGLVGDPGMKPSPRTETLAAGQQCFDFSLNNTPFRLLSLPCPGGPCHRVPFSVAVDEQNPTPSFVAGIAGNNEMIFRGRVVVSHRVRYGRTNGKPGSFKVISPGEGFPWANEGLEGTSQTLDIRHERDQLAQGGDEDRTAGRRLGRGCWSKSLTRDGMKRVDPLDQRMPRAGTSRWPAQWDERRLRVTPAVIQGRKHPL